MSGYDYMTTKKTIFLAKKAERKHRKMKAKKALRSESKRRIKEGIDSLLELLEMGLTDPIKFL